MKQIPTIKDMTQDKLRLCHVCGWRVAKYAPRCPACGQKDPGADGSFRGNRVLTVILGFVGFAYVISKYFPQLLN